MRSFDERLKTQLETTAILAGLMQDTDNERFEKVTSFAKKLLREEFTIAFAGHFSAGKSSMINALTGEQLLPTSPIPTSANIVTVAKSDTEHATIHFHEELPVRLEGDYDFEIVKALCRQGATVSRIEIGHADSALPEGVTVMDTPGVDSTDDAHRISTESALHLADLIFYVMDYNHVQSELNFHVTKDLLRHRQHLYLIVNQIDKHQEEELSFEAFKKSVHQSFSTWGVEPKGIFFTTLRGDSPYNEFEDVKRIVMDSIRDRQPRLLESAGETLQLLSDEHVDLLVSSLEDAKNSLMLSQEELDRPDELRTGAEKLKAERELLDPDKWVASFTEHRLRLLKNATLIPYELREMLKSYLESRQQDFKVGLLFSGKKTEEERTRRKEAALSTLRSITESQVSGHLRSLMKQSLREIGRLTDEASINIDRLSFLPSGNVLDDALPSGMTLTSESVLQYANRVSEETRSWFIQETNGWREEVRNTLRNDGASLRETLDQKIRLLEEKILTLDEYEKRKMAHDIFQAEADNPSATALERAGILLASWRAEMKRDMEVRPFESSMVHASKQIVEAEASPTSSVTHVHSDIVTERTERISQLLAKAPGFEDTVSYLVEKSARVADHEFTIALFGAFSAGKSSFCNALLGEKVLPVSPNPTTASINRIRPAGADRHNTADVQLKSAEQMTEDVVRAFTALGYDIKTLDDAYEIAPAVLREADSALTERSFIAAFREGYQEVKDDLGRTLVVDREHFESFVAKESKSCFVDVIDFFFDCPLTRLGVTLVDTPGADSINARHTGVAFEYIRNADAILFLTYYNHAFARADREFLIQLGRVKDAFELDKMFFLVNAIDLASTAEEVGDVLGYVASELQRFGIRFPRLYGVSSLLALTERSEETDHAGLKAFEQDFFDFLANDLRALAVASLAEETEKAVNRLRHLIHQTEANILRKDERMAEIGQFVQHVESRYAVPRTETIANELIQELKELLYYVMQRVYYRYPDFFKEAYNPVRFAHQKPAAALEDSLVELLGLLGFDFEQELRVTHFRIGEWVKAKLRERFEEERAHVMDLDAGIHLTPIDFSELDGLPFSGPFKKVDPYRPVNRIFKNTKSFFERNEKETLRDELSTLTKEEAARYLEAEGVRILDAASTYLETNAERLRLHLLDQSIEQSETERRSLVDAAPLKAWKETLLLIDRQT